MSDHHLEDIIDRRRLRRKLTFWRVVSVLAALILIFSLAYVSTPDETFGFKARPHVARVRVEGTVVEDEALLDILEDIANSKAVKGLIVTVDSPGGTTTGGEAIHDAVRKVAAGKPVVAQVGTLAASAGYMIAVAADHIVARQSSIVGSIGVLVQYPNVEELLDKIGVDVRTIKSSPLKAEPSIFDTPPPGAEEMIRDMVLDSYDWFKNLVQERRTLSEQEVAKLADGSIFTGRQALERKLVDELGGEDAAKAWLVAQGLDPDLEVFEWRKPDLATGFLFSRAVARALGLDPLLRAPAEALADRLLLDGLISLWHVDR
ncbi:signal peptide peptidase SppA [Oricola cellulosilytica]|uniref:Signal peptide peptidase SppA n=1 Tax=Oricola cellulosilytica TaxID=1429082 RepID=A0A4V2MP52_9HYPH|nr:signal peptide peptidase SppA [Oricola cellulosilytica]TCD16312.1 signal peptide peptidase SppA [Oricola cellulosilytica]